MAGKVMDESGKPLEGVTVKLTLLAPEAPRSSRTRRRVVHRRHLPGEWQVDFEFPPYEPRRISVSVAEMSRTPPVEIALKLDVNEVVRMESSGQRVDGQAGLRRGARRVRGGPGEVPHRIRLEPYIARTYYAEKKYDEAIKHLQIAIEKDPSDVENKLRLATS